MNLIARLAATARSWATLLVQPADAHCDTADGPAVEDGRRSLETGNPNYALKWVFADSEDEVRAAFDTAMAARGGDADEVARADQQFLETLVRVHRAGEGEGFDGIKPTGTELPPQVIAADAALDAGTIEPLRGLVGEDRWDELEKRFTIALGRKGFDPDDLDAARDYVAAYVSFFTYAEGEEHEHAHEHHAHQH